MKLSDLKALLESETDLDRYDDVMRVHAPALIACAEALPGLIAAIDALSGNDEADDGYFQLEADLHDVMAVARAALRALEGV